MRKSKAWLVRPIVVAVSGCFGMSVSWANPTGPQVISGSAAIQGLGTNNLKVTNTPGSIIHWQGFSIGAGQVTQFQQQSAASAVLNRVVGADISQIQGQLLSNGRVFLINPAGILIGAGAMIDTAGFVGSTLNMQDADFLAGKLRFQGDANSGSIVNHGWIKTSHGGNVVLVAPRIENGKDALIQTPGGELLLAAGQKLTIGSLDPNGVQFEIQAPTDSVVNLGKLIAEGGSVGVFAGTLKHSGDIRAGALERDAGGRIVLKAQSDLTVAAGSTMSVNGKSGGDVVIQSTAGQTRVAGEITATGSAARGGDIQVLGNRVTVNENASIDASGAGGGGQIRIGGDYQGSNSAVQNAAVTFVGANARLRADATEAGEGGRVIVWADKNTQYYGALSARGGVRAGNGGFAEVSGKENLIFAGTADLGAPNGRLGNLLLDPLELYVDNRGGNLISLIDEASDVPNNAVTITPAALASIPGNVMLYAGRYMRFTDAVDLTRPGQSLTATVAVYTGTDPAGTPPNQMDIAANISTNGGAVNLSAPSIMGIGGPTIATNGGAVTINATGVPVLPSGFQPATGFISNLNIDANALAGPGGAVNVSNANNSISLGTVQGGTFTGNGKSSLSTGALTIDGAVALSSPDGSVNTGAISSGGGSVTVGANSGVATGTVQTDGGALTINAANGNAGTGNITTSGGALNVTTGGSVTTSNITSGGAAVNLTAGGSVSTFNVTSSGADVNLTAGSNVSTTGITSGAGKIKIVGPSGISATGLLSTTNAAADSVVLQASQGPVSLSGTGGGINSAGGIAVTGRGSQFPFSARNAINVGTGSAITTPGSVTLTATQGSINARINNASSVTATTVSTDASYAGSVANITINSDTALNATNISATGTGCFFNDCIDSTVTLRAAGDLNVGSVSASGTPSPANFPATGTTLTELVSLRSDTGSIVRLPGTSQVRAQDVTLNTAAGPGRIGTSAAPLLIDVKRNLTFSSNGGFDILVNGASGPNQLNAIVGAGAASYTGTVNGGGIDLDATFDFATPTVVTLNNLTVTEVPGGFKNTVNNGTPGIAFSVPNGALIATSVNVPEGGTIATGSAPLPVSLIARDNVTVSSYTRGGSGNPDSLGKSTLIQSTTGSVNLGTIAGNKDSITVSAPGDVTISPTSITTAGNVSVTSTAGNINLGLIDTTSGTGSVTLSALSGNVQATSDNTDFEVKAGGPISVTGKIIGNPTLPLFANPLDLQAPKITLTSTGAGGQIGFANDAGALRVPIVAETSDLTIIAAPGNSANTGATFNVSTGTASLQMLSVKANAGGLATVGSDSRLHTNGLTKEYAFGNSGANVVVRGTTVAATDFTASDARFEVTTNVGGIAVDADLNVANAHLSLGAATFSGTGDINARARKLDAGQITLNTRSGSIETGDIGSGLVKPSSVTVTAGGIGSVSLTGVSASESLTITASGAVGTGDLNVPTITIRGPNTGATGFLNVQGAIGGTTAVHSFSARSSRASIQGAITGDGLDGGGVSITTTEVPAAGDPGINIGGAIAGFGGNSTITLNSGAAPLRLGPAGAGEITAGDGSTIELTQAGAVFDFATLNAGPAGTVNIYSAPGIQQSGGTGITAQNVALGGGPAGGGGVSNTASIQRAGGGALDLNAVKNLKLNSNGIVNLNANGSTLESLDVTKGTTNTAFTLANLTGQTVNILFGVTDVTVEATSSAGNPLDFFLTTIDGGIIVNPAGGGIVTQGGSVALTALDGAINNAAPAGINTDYGVNPVDPGRGHVTLQTRNSGSITTGVITTNPTALKPAVVDPVTPAYAIRVNTNCASCDIVVSGDLNTGTAGGPIVLDVSTSGSITRTAGTITSQSPDSVIIKTADGNIGGPTVATPTGTPLQIDSPSVQLSALAATPSATAGNVFATLTNTTSGSTTNLNLTALRSFDVNSLDKPFDVLSVATNGTGDAAPPVPLNLTAPGQTYSFARVPFGGSLTPNSFELITAATDSGAVTPAAPPSSATFTALNGNLLVRGGANLTSPNLKLETIAADGDLILQGNTANPLALTNTGTQEFIANRDLSITGKVTLTGGTQLLSSNTGNVLLTGGAALDESVNVSATVQQYIFTSFDTGGNVVLQAGTGEGASVTASFIGPQNNSLVGANAETEQQIEARGGVSILGGNGTSLNSFALVSSNQGQLVRAGNNARAGTILVKGGSGQNATARIVNSGGANQQVGEDRFADCCSLKPYQTVDITVQGGAGSGSSASISSEGPQQVLSRGGTVRLEGDGAGAFASIESSSAATQEVGSTANNVILTGGTGSGAYARIRNTGGFQSVNAANAITLTGQGENASATLIGVGQNVQGGSVALNAGAANNSDASIQSSGTFQTVSASNLSLLAGGGPGATSTAQILAGGRQTVSASGTTLITGGAGPNSIARIRSEAGANVNPFGAEQTISLTGNVTLQGGTAEGAYARIDGNGDQSFSYGTLTMNGGSASGAYARIDGNGDQSFNYGTLTMNGGSASGAFAKIDAPNGNQTLSGGNMTLSVMGNQTTPVANAGAIIEGRNQTKTNSAGVIRLNGGAGTAGAGNSSDAVLRNLAGNQDIRASGVIVVGGFHDSTAGIFNLGAGTQMVRTNGPTGISLTGNATSPEAEVGIRNGAATLQTITASNAAGMVALNNTGIGLVDIASAGSQNITGNGGIAVTAAAAADARITAPGAQTFNSSNGGILVSSTSRGNASITSGATQQFTSRFVDVTTGLPSVGDATISAMGNQWFHTTNGLGAPPGGGSMRVAAFGSGVASIESGARQLLEIDYPEALQTTPTSPPGSVIIGAATGAGDSRIRAVDQNVFARSIVVQGGTDAGRTSKLSSSATQTISTLDGSLRILGGSGGSAAIESGTQTMVANGAVELAGGSGVGTSAAISSANSQTLYVTKDATTLTGGSGAGSFATIQAGGTQSFVTRGNTTLTGGTGAGSAATFQAGDAQLLQVTNATLALTGGAAADAVARITTPAAQTLSYGALSLTGGGSGGAGALIDTLSTQTLSGGDVTLTGGSGDNGLARITTPGMQSLLFESLHLQGGGGAGAHARIDSGGAQSFNGGNVMLSGGTGAGANALIDTTGSQLVNLSGDLILGGGGGANSTARITTTSTQTLGFDTLSMSGGAGSGAFARIDSSGAQTFNGGSMVLTGNGGPGASALIDTPDAQSANLSGGLVLAGGSGADSFARMSAGGTQTLGFHGASVTGGTGAGAFAGIDTASTQTLTGTTANIALTSSGGSASIVGHNQTISCGIACSVVLQGSTGASEAAIRNLSGNQTITAGAVSLLGNQNAGEAASVLIENVPATAQTITAQAGDTVLQSRGSGTVAITSGGTQTIETRGLDVRTQTGANPALNAANATLSAVGDQFIHTRGLLGGAGTIGARVVSRTTGTAKIQSGGNQVLHIGSPELVDGQLVIGSLNAVTPGNPPNPAFAGVGDSLVIATNTASPASANQTVLAGSLYVQGPSNDFRISKLSADGTQTVTTFAGGITIIGGAGTDSFAIIDPTTQTISAFGPILLQGGSGPNADALINATGPQSVTSETGDVTLRGGTGRGADALIETLSSSQTVHGARGASPILENGPDTGGLAGLTRGTDNTGASIASIASNSVSNELVREQNSLTEALEDTGRTEENERNLKRAAQTCR